ncbi:MAG: YesL family protein [Oscillospiraceae bacterium]|nr:YesL family protein [Oscillospiraceae bacterium]
MKDSALYRALGWIIDLVVSGLLWIVCSLPVFTVGASSAALYHTVVKCIRHGRGSLSRVFWESFRGNFRIGTGVWLVYLAALAVGAGNVIAVRQLGAEAFSPLAALAGVIFLPVALTLPWVFAYISRFENTVGGSLKFVGYLAVKNPLRSLLLAAELFAAALIAWLIPYIAPLLPGPFAMLFSLTVEPVFRQYTADAAVEDAWFNE